jgi:hypothetical protein
MSHLTPNAAQPDADTACVRSAPRVAIATATVPPSAIPQIGEFIDCLRSLLNLHVLVRISDSSCGWSLDGSTVYTAHTPLVRFGLVERYRNPHGFEGVEYYRLTASGSRFARDALRRWKAMAWWQRLWLRAWA